MSGWPAQIAGDATQFPGLFLIMASLPLLAAAFMAWTFSRLRSERFPFWTPLTGVMVVGAYISVSFWVATLIVSITRIGWEGLTRVPPGVPTAAVFALFFLGSMSNLTLAILNVRIRRERMDFAEEQQRTEEENRFKTNLLNTASHELNTPLTPIRAELSLLVSGALGEMSEAQRESVQIIDRNTKRLQDMVEEVMQATRLQTGRLPVASVEHDVLSPLGDAVRTYQATADALGVTLRAKRLHSVQVMADPARVFQIVVNLIDNGLKFADRGGTVTVSMDHEDHIVAITVRDDGMGMTKDQLSRLFQPFGRVHAQYPAGKRGTGMGLYICHGIAAEMGGTLTAASDGPGKGARFTLCVPVA